MNIFSDHFRWLKITGGLLVIIGLLLFNYFQTQKQVADLADIINHPQAHAGLPLALHYAMVVGKNDSTMTVAFQGLWLDAVPRYDWDLYEQVSLRGTWEADGKVHVTFYHRHQGKWLKLYISQVPMLVIFFMLWRRYRFSFKRFLISERDVPHA
jgi:hypothetical protein